MKNFKRFLFFSVFCENIVMGVTPLKIILNLCVIAYTVFCVGLDLYFVYSIPFELSSSDTNITYDVKLTNKICIFIYLIYFF